MTLDPDANRMSLDRLDGDAALELRVRSGKVASQIFTSWNPIAEWLRRVEGLRGAA
jgi:hypothetical protein